ncbi:hypothetical protein E3E31_00170 [Thermococcus sp. M39]|uniref:hypothetical protein n=1 Tax=unclassified Thermococcus TaxID=2627626 RepID=UPI00143AE38C|nr:MULTISPECIES: hypothetical protein [unclassified Thermococcus]NJE06972.1 hypothetical protein [Thermococcus sp. M39]NJE12866.1 hypothetical protein [Thermococcus sp. LS2]
MIALTAAIVGGALAGFYLPALLPVIYILKRYNKDLALFGFFAYALAIGYIFNVNTLFSDNGILAVFAIAIPHLLVLDSILRDGFIDFNERGVLFSLALALSYLYEYAFMLLVVVALVLRFYSEFGRKELVYSLGTVGLTLAFLYLFRGYFRNDYTGQVVVLASISLIAFSLLAKREVKRERIL